MPNVKQVDLWYPGTKSPETVDAVQVSLMHVRAAPDIRVHYDFERDGYVISRQNSSEWIGDTEPTWVEHAFVPAWEGFIG